MPNIDERAVPAGTGDGSGIDQLGGRIDFENSPYITVRQERLPVHVRGTLTGFVLSGPNGHEAITAGGASLGRFNTQQAAACAVAANWIGQHGQEA